VVPLGRKDDKRVGDVVGDDAHLLLEDRRRTLRLSRRPRHPRGTTGERDAARGACRAARRTGRARPETARPAADATPSTVEPPTGPAHPAATGEPAAGGARDARHTAPPRRDPSAHPATP